MSHVVDTKTVTVFKNEKEFPYLRELLQKKIPALTEPSLLYGSSRAKSLFFIKSHGKTSLRSGLGRKPIPIPKAKSFAHTWSIIGLKMDTRPQNLLQNCIVIYGHRAVVP